MEGSCCTRQSIPISVCASFCCAHGQPRCESRGASHWRPLPRSCAPTIDFCELGSRSWTDFAAARDTHTPLSLCSREEILKDCCGLLYNAQRARARVYGLDARRPQRGPVATFHACPGLLFPGLVELPCCGPRPGWARGPLGPKEVMEELAHFTHSTADAVCNLLHRSHRHHLLVWPQTARQHRDQSG